MGQNRESTEKSSSGFVEVDKGHCGQDRKLRTGLMTPWQASSYFHRTPRRWQNVLTHQYSTCGVRSPSLEGMTLLLDPSNLHYYFRTYIPSYPLSNGQVTLYVCLRSFTVLNLFTRFRCKTVPRQGPKTAENKRGNTALYLKSVPVDHCGKSLRKSLKRKPKR